MLRMAGQQPREGTAAGTGRVFIALWPPTEVAARIVRQTSAVVGMQRGRAAHTQDLHLTLAFLGELDAQKLEDATKVVARFEGPSFELELDRLGCFKGTGVLWLAPSRPSPRLGASYERVWHELAAIGFTPERRVFKPHITLARRARPMRALPLDPSISWRVETLALATSLPGTKGPPRYRRLSVRALTPA
jgi:RNA 2',3'-cyclic 3'-phosphodiesterase